MNCERLDPWRVIAASLLDLSNYEIPRILDRAGLAVDWNLDEKQNYSDKTRKAAYRPRINLAYEAISEEEQLRVAYIVASELADREQGDSLNTNLSRIGWSIEAGKLKPTGQEVWELFFPPGSSHDAYVEIRAIAQKAETSIMVIDPYLDATTFSFLSAVTDTVMSIRLLTLKYPNDFLLEAKKFLSQYNKLNLEIRESKDFHDRFLILDDKECWHLGASIKDAGGKAFMISRIEDEKNRLALVDELVET
jgi:hypothetical protein